MIRGISLSDLVGHQLHSRNIFCLVVKARMICWRMYFLLSTAHPSRRKTVVGGPATLLDNVGVYGVA
jgi:hypothetical protein